MSLLAKIFTIEGAKQFFRVRDKEGKLSGEQILASTIQVGLMCLLAYALYLMEII